MRSRRIHALVACGALMAALWLGVPSSVSMAAAQDDLILTRGTVITVTSLSDELNGDASTVAGLMARPGPDGLSLREAIEATNQDPGLYTVEFAADLAGLTISAAPLPQLLSGGVIINGDIDGDSKPDITIQAASTADYNPGLTVSSGDNTLHALDLIGWGQGVSLSPPETETDATYANTTLANLVIRDVRTGILLNSPGGGELRDTQNRWLDTRIVGNRINATYGGVELHKFDALV